MATTGLKVSKRLENFINFYEEAISTYRYAFDMVNKCDKLKCDLLHKIELGLFEDKNEEKRIQTQLKYCLKDRRYYKDRVEELEPFVELFYNKNKERDIETRAYVTCMNNIKNTLGSVRKMEDYHKERTYKPRILKDTYGE